MARQPYGDCLGMCALAAGDERIARRLYEESSAILQRIEHPWLIAITFRSLGNLELLEGDLAEPVRISGRASLSPTN
jgi:hypothetical protein